MLYPESDAWDWQVGYCLFHPFLRISSSHKMDQTNLKNDNWHWVEKNCIPWAKGYVSTQLKGPTKEVTGENSAAMRSFALSKFKDQRFLSDPSKTWNLPNSTRRRPSGDASIFLNSCIARMRMNLCANHAVIGDQILGSTDGRNLANFLKNMIAANGKDVHIDKDEMKVPPSGTEYKPKPPAANDAEDAKKLTVPSSVAGEVYLFGGHYW
ncbi:hypothetical protein BJ741DRAFT_709675 [Chytriomyces cf. hyalinus JEL632]|nr:hypothetical protein BJ741DRAFT_709675 [Chytriomyces cf. hyalinus JEL632]